MFSEPLKCQGFYATRVLGRRAVKAVVVTALVVGCLIMATTSIIGIAANVVAFALVIR